MRWPAARIFWMFTTRTHVCVGACTHRACTREDMHKRDYVQVKACTGEGMHGWEQRKQAERWMRRRECSEHERLANL